MDHPLFYHPNITVLLSFGLYHLSSLFILWVYISKLQRHLGRWEILKRLTFPLFIPSTPPPTPLSLPVFQEKVRFAISGNLRTVKIDELSHSGKDPDTRQNKCQKYLPRKRERTQLMVTFWFLISPLLIPVLLGKYTCGLPVFPEQYVSVGYGQLIAPRGCWALCLYSPQPAVPLSLFPSNLPVQQYFCSLFSHSFKVIHCNSTSLSIPSCVILGNFRSS